MATDDVEMDLIKEEPENDKEIELVTSVVGEDVCLIEMNRNVSLDNGETALFSSSPPTPTDETRDNEQDNENSRPDRPTKIVLYKASTTDEIVAEDNGPLTPITAHQHLLKNKVGISDDGNKRIVKTVRAFYYFPKVFGSFDKNEIVIARLTDRQDMYNVYSIKNLAGNSIDVPRARALPLTPNIWKYGVKNKHFVPVDFIKDLINANRPELIELAYLQLPILDTYIPNPFSTLERKKKPISRHESILHMCARNGTTHSMSYLLENRSPHFPLTLQSNMFSRGDSILQAAIECNDLDIVEVILEYVTRTDVDKEPIRSKSGLFSRPKRKQPTKEESSQQSADTRSKILDQQNDNTETPLHVCLRRENFECLKMLIRYNANIAAEDKYGNSVVHTAALRNKRDGLKEMLSVFEEKEDGIEEWQSVLKIGNKKSLVPAALATEIPVVEVLLERADTGADYDDELGHLLFWAAGRNKLELARYLIEKGASVNVENENGQTPLKLACVRGHVDLAELILDHNQDPNYTGEHSRLTAMNSAAKSGHLDVVELLRRHNVHLWDQAIMETSALHSAIAGGQSQLAEFLIEQATMDSNARDKFEKTPLYYAIEEGHPDCVKVLLRNQADPELAVDETGQKAVHLAVKNDKRQILKILLDFGARPDEATPEGETPLLIAIQKDYAHILQLLMLNNVNIEREDEENNNLMHLIAISKASKCASFLLKDQSISKVRDMILKANYDDKTPINIARDNRSQEVLQLLIQYVPIDFFSKDSSIFHVLYNDKQFDILKLIFNRMSLPVKERADLVSCNPSFLDANEQGEDPYSPHFSYLLPSFLHKLIDCRDNELKEHPLVKIAVREKLRVYRIWYVFTFFVFLLFLVALAIALVFASYDCDEEVAIQVFSTNKDPYRVLRLICELFILGYGVNLFLNELVEFILVWSHRYKDKNTHYKRDNEHFSKKKTSDENVVTKIRVLVNSSTIFNTVDRRMFYFLTSFASYISDNLVDLSGLISLAILITFRYSGNRSVEIYQWWFAALTFVIYTLTLFKYTKIIPALGSYVETVTHVFFRDIPRFLVILGIVVIAFVGGIHLAARQPLLPSAISNGTYEMPLFLGSMKTCNVSQGVPNTRVFWLSDMLNMGYDLRRPLITGTFFILDSGAEEVQNDLLTMNIAFTILYFCFAFAIIVVLSNILIAQLSQTYAEFNKQNEFHYQLQLVLSIELQSNIAFFLGKYFRRYAFVREFNVPYKDWVKLEDNSPGRDIERRITLIEENIERNFQILSEESLKSSQRKDTLDAMGERLGDLGGKIDLVKNYIEDPQQSTLRRRRLTGSDSSRMSFIESKSFSISDTMKADRISALETKVNHIIQLLEQNAKD